MDLDLNFPTLYKRTEIMYLGEFEEEIVFTLTENIYREELLKLFKLEYFDSKAIDEKIELLYNLIKNDKNIKELVDILEEKYEHCPFVFLFSYDLFYLFYPCIQNILRGLPVEIEELKDLIKML
jgi:hypothetical protein